MARKRLWAKFDLGFADHPKIAGLSDAAFRMLVEMILWSRAGLTDGFIPDAVAERKWHIDSLTDSGCESLNELLTNGIRASSLSRVDGGYQIHDFTEMQDSRADVEARSDANRANVERRWKRTEVRTVQRTEYENDTETETEIKNKSALERADVRAIFDAFNASLEERGVKPLTETKRNTDAARLMIDKDGRTLDQILTCIKWVTGNAFWSANILSLSKLRQQYDQLRLQAQRDKPTPPPEPAVTYGFNYDDD
jgi:hypothetical protein